MEGALVSKSPALLHPQVEALSVFGCRPPGERGGQRPFLPITFYVPALYGLLEFIAKTLLAPLRAYFSAVKLMSLSDLPRQRLQWLRINHILRVLL